MLLRYRFVFFSFFIFQAEYERQRGKAKKPASVAWEVRKSSPAVKTGRAMTTDPLNSSWRTDSDSRTLDETLNESFANLSHALRHDGPPLDDRPAAGTPGPRRVNSDVSLTRCSSVSVEVTSSPNDRAAVGAASAAPSRASADADDDGGLWLGVDLPGTTISSPAAPSRDGVAGRSPGEGLLMHQKLSSPSRKKPLEVSLKLAEEKQQKAEQAREKFQSERATRLRESNTVKLQEVRRRRRKVTHADIDERIQRANSLRESVIEQRRRKAQEEEQKVNEVAFIQKLEGMNKKMEVMERQQDRESSKSARLSQMEVQRLRRVEERAAHDSAVLARRLELETQRQARLKEIVERRQVRHRFALLWAWVVLIFHTVV